MEKENDWLDYKIYIYNTTVKQDYKVIFWL